MTGFAVPPRRGRAHERDVFPKIFHVKTFCSA
jgi:hypothetical protein